jgi:hypothetical protein
MGVFLFEKIIVLLLLGRSPMVEVTQHVRVKML